MKNKTIVFIFIAFLVFLITISLSRRSYPKNTYSESIPLIPIPNKEMTIPETITPQPTNYPKTNTQEIVKLSDPALATTELKKLETFLPLHQSNFPTSTKIKTTINIYKTDDTPSSTIRLEISGVDYHQTENININAIAFRESFIEGKRQLVSLGINPKNLQIVFGDYQYIQTTATNWIKTFNLLD